MPTSRSTRLVLSRLLACSPTRIRTIQDALAGAPSGAAGAVLTPAAMAVGALGLATVWAVAPAGRAVAPPPAAWTTIRPAFAPILPLAEQAAPAGPGLLGRLFSSLGASPSISLSGPPILTRTADRTTAELKALEATMITSAELEAQTRLKTLRARFQATGLDAKPYLAQGRSQAAATSPSELGNSRLLAAKLDLDPTTARKVQAVAAELIAARTLGQAAAAIPIGAPVDSPTPSSPFGERLDPFTGRMAFHPGQDFSGRYGQAIHVTAPGVISFVGQRTGYGGCVEVDHGYGFKTRYAHLSGFTLGLGSVVKTGDVIGRMGSTGRSTGVHLHYEVWANGRLLNPTPFVKAAATAPALS